MCVCQLFGQTIAKGIVGVFWKKPTLKVINDFNETKDTVV